MRTEKNQREYLNTGIMFMKGSLTMNSFMERENYSILKENIVAVLNRGSFTATDNSNGKMARNIEVIT